MKRMKSVDILKGALKKFGRNGRNWIQGSYARQRKNGDGVGVHEASARCFCAVGAMQSVIGPLPAVGLKKARWALAKAIGGQLNDSEGSVLRFNDRTTTTFKDVRRAFRKAIRILEAA
jgi:hypothetical protein